MTSESTRRRPIEVGEVIRGAKVLVITGDGEKRKCRLLCRCRREFLRAYSSVLAARATSAEPRCNTCLRENKRRNQTMWMRRPPAAE